MRIEDAMDGRAGAVKPRAPSRLVTALLMANLVFATAIGLELAARVVSYGAIHWRGGWAKADGYFGAPWTDQFYAESLASGYVDWRSYVYWRRRPFAGTFIHVDNQGIRRTWQPPSGGQYPRVFVMGGSTVWGTGARDDETIPSLLARELAARQQPATVVNLGETGYVTRQDVTALISRLQAGDVPDVAVFYGGINDVYAAHQNGTPGLPQNEFNRRLEFNASNPEGLGQLLRMLPGGTQFVADAIRRRLLSRAAASAPRTRGQAALGKAVIDDYCANLRTVRALAAEYGFSPVFFWQPVIFTKPSLTPYERAERDRFAHTQGLFDRVYAPIRTGRNACPGFVVHDLSGVFEHEPRPMYIDALHLTEKGNQVVVRAMIAPVSEVLAAREGGLR